MLAVTAVVHRLSHFLHLLQRRIDRKVTKFNSFLRKEAKDQVLLSGCLGGQSGRESSALAAWAAPRRAQ